MISRIYSQKALSKQHLSYYNIMFDSSEFINRCEELSKRWYADLEALMEKPPSKEKALEMIHSKIKKI